MSIGYVTAKQLAVNMQYNAKEKTKQGYANGARLGTSLAQNAKRYTKQQIIKMAKSLDVTGDCMAYRVGFLYEYVDTALAMGKMEPEEAVNLYDFYEMGVISASQAGIDLSKKV